MTAVATQKLKFQTNTTLIRAATNSTDPHDIGWVDMRDYSSILIGILTVTGTGGLEYADGIRVLANADSAGGGTDVVVKTKTLTAGTDPDAVGDYTFVEVSAEEIRSACDAVGIAGRYVSLSLHKVTGTDVHAVTYIRKALGGSDGLTADSIA